MNELNNKAPLPQRQPRSRIQANEKAAPPSEPVEKMPRLQADKENNSPNVISNLANVGSENRRNPSRGRSKRRPNLRNRYNNERNMPTTNNEPEITRRSNDRDEHNAGEHNRRSGQKINDGAGYYSRRSNNAVASRGDNDLEERNRGTGSTRFGNPNIEDSGEVFSRRGDDFYIHQKLNNISSLALEIDSTDVTAEKKFSGRNRLYVGNLARGVTENDLHELFKPYGEIGDIFSFLEKNFTFLKVDYRANAEKAKQALNGFVYKERTLRVRFAPNVTVLRVTNLSPYVSNELLYKSFEIFGPLERAQIVVDNRGNHTGEGIVIFAKRSSANACQRLCEEKCFFLTASLRPCLVEPFEPNDDSAGLPESALNKNENEFKNERSVGPRFAEPGSFDHEYGTKRKLLNEFYKKKQNALMEEVELEKEKLQKEMQTARFEYETKLLRQELIKRELDIERSKMEWKMRESKFEDRRELEAQNMHRRQYEEEPRIECPEFEMRRRDFEMQQHPRFFGENSCLSPLQPNPFRVHEDLGVGGRNVDFMNSTMESGFWSGNDDARFRDNGMNCPQQTPFRGNEGLDAGYRNGNRNPQFEVFSGTPREDFDGRERNLNVDNGISRLDVFMGAPQQSPIRAHENFGGGERNPNVDNMNLRMEVFRGAAQQSPNRAHDTFGGVDRNPTVDNIDLRMNVFRSAPQQGPSRENFGGGELNPNIDINSRMDVFRGAPQLGPSRENFGRSERNANIDINSRMNVFRGAPQLGPSRENFGGSERNPNIDINSRMDVFRGAPQQSPNPHETFGGFECNPNVDNINSRMGAPQQGSSREELGGGERNANVGNISLRKDIFSGAPQQGPSRGNVSFGDGDRKPNVGNMNSQIDVSSESSSRGAPQQSPPRVSENFGDGERNSNVGNINSTSKSFQMPLNNTFPESNGHPLIISLIDDDDVKPDINIA